MTSRTQNDTRAVECMTLCGGSSVVWIHDNTIQLNTFIFLQHTVNVIEIYPCLYFVSRYDVLGDEPCL